ncbi:MAG: hypothetical protein WC372_06920 [Candidatus Neomarinimicrobiota bacterium]|jgi:hypothetical protein
MAEQKEAQSKVSVYSLVMTIVVAIVTVALAWGRMEQATASIDKAIEQKLDKEVFQMYLQQTEQRLKSIDSRLARLQDGVDKLNERTAKP